MYQWPRITSFNLDRLVLCLFLTSAIGFVGAPTWGEELVGNGSFDDGLSSWSVVVNQGCGGTRTANVISSDPPYENVLEVKSVGAGGCGGSSGMEQSLNIDVAAYSSIALSSVVKSIHYSTGSGCGWTGWEYPLNVRIRYLSTDAESRSLVFAFHHGGDTCGSPTSSSTTTIVTQYISQNQWYSLNVPNILNYIPDAETITAISIYGNGWDYTGRADNVSLFGEPAALPDIQITASADKAHYQNGIDTALISIEIVNNSASEWTVDLSADLVNSIGRRYVLGSDFFSILPSNSNIVQFSFPLPDTSVTFEFDANVIADVSPPSGQKTPLRFSKFKRSIFTSSGIDWWVLDDIANDLRNIWAEASGCVDAVVDVIPGGALATALLEFKDLMQESRDLKASGKYGEAHELQQEAFMVLSGATGEQIGQATIDYLCDGDASCSVASAAYIEFVKGRIARDCFNQEFGVEYWLTPSQGSLGVVGQGKAFADSLSEWYRQPMERVGSSVVDAIFVGGSSDITVNARGTWARRDTTGLMPLEIAPVDSAGVIVSVGEDIRSFRDSSGANPNGEISFLIKSDGVDPVGVALNHRIGPGTVLTFRYPEFSLSSDGEARIQIDSESRYPALIVDADGDGYSESTLYPLSGADAPLETRSYGLDVASPNPFNPQTTIAFELPEQEAVTLRVFDVAGRLVRVLVDGEVFDQGRHEAIWRGKDESGRQMSSGTYFYRLEAGQYSETKRMVLVK